MKYGHKHAVLSPVTLRPTAVKLSFNFFLKSEDSASDFTTTGGDVRHDPGIGMHHSSNASPSFNSASYIFPYCKMRM